MKKYFNSFIVLCLLISGGCREFYDEEFEEFEATQESTAGGGGTNGQEVTYKADLKTTDQKVLNLSGSAKISVQGDKVSVQLEVDGIPANIIQIHYSYIAADCRSLVINIPNNNTTTRSYSITEETTSKALSDDLLSSGAAATQGDVNLNGKSLVVKSFSNFSGLPNSSGTNQLTILCGRITIDDRPTEDDEGDETSSDGTFELPDPNETPAPLPEIPTSTTGGLEIPF